MVPFATGSLGHGLPLGCGLALGEKIKGIEAKTFVIMSDGECNEGTVWESVQFASSKNLDNLFVLVDHNKLQATGSIKETISDISLANAFAGFKWNVKEIDGHDHTSIKTALDMLPRNGKPNVLICHTIKGKGVTYMENDNNWHYRAPNKEELKTALVELRLNA
jgi:transketolase